MHAVVFCGIQGSGKSTYYAARFAPTHVRINLDTLKTRGRERELLDACLRNGRPFVVDNTNPTAADRTRYLAPALAAGFDVAAYLFDVPPREAIARNAGRPPGERIPVPGILGTQKRLELPTVAEGFSEVLRVRPLPDGGFEVELLEPRVAATSSP